MSEDEVGGLPSSLSKVRRSAPCLKTASSRKERRVIVVGDSLLRGTEGPMCQPDPTRREVCCLPGALRRSAPCLKTASSRKERRVIVVGDSLLRGTEGPMCQPDPTRREVCCLPGAHIRDIARKVPGLVCSSDYCPRVSPLSEGKADPSPGAGRGH